MELHVSLLEGGLIPHFEVKPTPLYKLGYTVDAKNRRGMTEDEALTEMQNRIDVAKQELRVEGLDEKRQQAVQDLMSGVPGPIILRQPKEPETPLGQMMADITSEIFALCAEYPAARDVVQRVRQEH